MSNESSKRLGPAAAPIADVDGARAAAATQELTNLLARFTPESSKGISHLLDILAEKTEELFVVKGERVTAMGATKNVVFLEPSALFYELLAALRIAANELH